jgi:hypothetical protein
MRIEPGDAKSMSEPDWQLQSQKRKQDRNLEARNPGTEQKDRKWGNQGVPRFLGSRFVRALDLALDRTARPSNRRIFLSSCFPDLRFV